MDEKWGFEPQGVGGKTWLVSVVRSVASNATVDAGHPTHDLHTLSHCWQRGGQTAPTIFLDRPVGESWGFEPQGVGTNWLVSVDRSVASKATVDAGHPTHDQRRWQVAVWFNFISFNV